MRKNYYKIYVNINYIQSSSEQNRLLVRIYKNLIFINIA